LLFNACNGASAQQHDRQRGDDARGAAIRSSACVSSPTISAAEKIPIKGTVMIENALAVAGQRAHEAEPEDLRDP